MARRRTRVDVGTDDVMPLVLLGVGERVGRRAWFESRQLYAWSDQHEAVQRAREVYGLRTDGRGADDPDPRELFRDLDNNAAPIRRRGASTR